MDVILRMLHDCAAMYTCHITGENGAESMVKDLVSSGNLGVQEPKLLFSAEGDTITHSFMAVNSDCKADNLYSIWYQTSALKCYLIFWE